MLKLGREGADGYGDSALGITAGPEAGSSAPKRLHSRRTGVRVADPPVANTLPKLEQAE